MAETKVSSYNNKKFDSYHNTRLDSKYNAYQYKPNTSFHTNSHCVKSDEDYYEESCENLENKAENLCEIWNMLGSNYEVQALQNPQREYQKQSAKQEAPCQLTEQELMECFGIKNTEQIKENSKMTQQLKEKQIGSHISDEDLKEIWGEYDEHSDPVQAGTSAQKTQANKQSTVNSGEDIQEQQSQIGLVTLQVSCADVLDRQHNLSQNSSEPYLKLDLSQKPKVIIEQSAIDRQAEKDQNSNDLENTPGQKSIKESMSEEIEKEKNFPNLNKLIIGKDYEIFNVKKFVLNTFKPSTYTYFGVESRKQIRLQGCPYTQNRLLNQQTLDPLYLHSFQTNEAFLECKQQKLSENYIQQLSVKKQVMIATGHKIEKKIMEFNSEWCYKIRVCSTRQHIATIFYKSIKDGILYDMRAFNEYEQKHEKESIALIEVKDGYMTECCYCDTNVYMQKPYSTNPNLKSGSTTPLRSHSSIEKLRMILNIKDGKLTANMGINNIESSPYNACLETVNQRKYVFMMGLVKGGLQTNSYVIKVGEGVSPLLGLAISASRKAYIDSFE